MEDEASGEMVLHQAGHAYALRQSVAGREDNVEEYAMEGLEWKQRRDALVNQFGSKKKKAAIRSVSTLSLFVHGDQTRESLFSLSVYIHI